MGSQALHRIHKADMLNVEMFTFGFENRSKTYLDNIFDAPRIPLKHSRVSTHISSLSCRGPKTLPGTGAPQGFPQDPAGIRLDTCRITRWIPGIPVGPEGVPRVVPGRSLVRPWEVNRVHWEVPAAQATMYLP